MFDDRARKLGYPRRTGTTLLRAQSRLLFPLAVLALGAWARAAPWEHVFGGPHPQLLGDSDASYHVLRAERWLAGAPGAPWRDPSLNWPHGADVPWPPLFDAMLAGAASLFCGPVVERDTLVSVAAFLPPLLGLAFVLVVAALGRRILGPGKGWIGALVITFTAAGVDPSRVGRPDQHVLETVLFGALLLAYLGRRPPRSPGRAYAATAAIVVALAFWAWMGSALHLLILVAMAALLHLLPSRLDPRDPALDGSASLAVAGLGGAALLATSVLLWGRAGALASASTTGVGGLQVSMAAASGLFGALLHLARRRRPVAGALARLGEAFVAAAIPGLLLLLVPSLRAGIAGGLTALTAGNPWYATISEFQPLLTRSGEPPFLTFVMLMRGYGLTLFLAPVAIVAFLRAWRDDGVDRHGLTALAVLFVVFLPAAFIRKRFGVYAIIPLAFAAELALRDLSARLARRAGAQPDSRMTRALAIVFGLVTVLPSFPEHGLADPTLPPDKRELLRWIGDQPVPAGRECVVAPWSYGHSIQYFAARPVITSPFGTEGGPGAMEAAAKIWFSTDGAVVEALLAERRCGLLLLGIVPSEARTLHGFAPPGTPAPFETVAPRRRSPDPAGVVGYWLLAPARLYHEDGLPTSDLPAIDGFRLLVETPSTSPGKPDREDHWKLFEPVAGARLVVKAAPGTPVRATVDLQTNTARALEWTTAAVVQPSGTAALRLPYSTGDNGLTRAGPWTIQVGDLEATLVVREAAVVEGRILEIAPPRPSR